MSSTKSATAPRYTTWAAGRTLRGTAKQILTQIQKNAKSDSMVGRISLDEYVNTLIEDGGLFFPDRTVPEFLANQEFPTSFDRALEYLAAMPSSGFRILSRD